MKVKVQTLDAAEQGDIELNEAVFGVEPRADILHRVVTWQLEKRRGTARGTRERADVARVHEVHEPAGRIGELGLQVACRLEVARGLRLVEHVHV